GRRRRRCLERRPARGHHAKDQRPNHHSHGSSILAAWRPSYRNAVAGAALYSSVVTDLEPFEARDAGGAVRGVLHRPSARTGDGAVLAHGAGSNRDSPVLRAVAAAFAARGIAALRIDLPFRQARPKGPPP